MVNLKLKFWVYNEKNMNLHLISKILLLWVEPWGVRMQWEHTTFIHEQCTGTRKNCCYELHVIIKLIEIQDL